MKRLALFLLGTTTVAWAQIRFVNGTEVALGDAAATVARRVGEDAYPSSDDRRPRQDSITTGPAQFDFDQGRLWRVRISHIRMILQPIAPFREGWRNLPPMDSLKIASNMARTKFDAYLAAWKQQAAEAGKKEGVDYWITQSGTPDQGRDVMITFGPKRRLVGTGRLTGDSWSFQFYPETSRNGLPPEVAPGALRSLVVVGDDFSTNLRGEYGKGEDKVLPPPPESARAGLILEDGTQLYFGQTQTDAERALGAPAIQLRPSARPWMSLDVASVGFAEDRLYSISYNPRRLGVPAPFPEAWKNLTPVGARALAAEMTLEEFELYYEAWQARAATAGLVAGKNFTMGWMSEASGNRIVRLSLRSAAGGKEDWWRLDFAAIGPESRRVWKLRAINALSGEFFRGTTVPPKLDEKEPTLSAELPALDLPLPEIVLPKL